MARSAPTGIREAELRVAPQSVRRLKDKLQPNLRAGRGRSLQRVFDELEPVIRGWVAYFRMAEVKASLEELDQWLRRKLRCILWRQGKRPKTRIKKLVGCGIEKDARRQTSASGSRINRGR